MAEELKGKVAAITGAASGIGLATAEAMLKAGATVVLVDRDEKALKQVCAKFGDAAIPQLTDLLDTDSCAAMVPEILEKAGQIDILLCNAGVYIGGDLVEANGTKWAGTLDVEQTRPEAPPWAMDHTRLGRGHDEDRLSR
jgi:ribitol 2-dehydrogenase